MSENDMNPNGDLQAVASLAEPIRRSLYDYVVKAGEPVSRDDAAAALEISRQVAAYHLDRLAGDGLLQIEFRRLTGREGPGAGRPSKLYSRSDEVHEVSIPPRRYELAARVLLDAARESGMDGTVLSGVAHQAGVEMGEAGLPAALAAAGYEPVVEDGETRFRNCPFHVLRDRDQEMTCALNLALVAGMVDSSGEDTAAVLAPEDGYCCVRLNPAIDCDG